MFHCVSHHGSVKRVPLSSLTGKSLQKTFALCGIPVQGPGGPEEQWLAANPDHDPAMGPPPVRNRQRAGKDSLQALVSVLEVNATTLDQGTRQNITHFVGVACGKVDREVAQQPGGNSTPRGKRVRIAGLALVQLANWSPHNRGLPIPFTGRGPAP